MYNLQDLGFGLELTLEDTLFFLYEIADKTTIDERDTTVWTELIRYQGHSADRPLSIREVMAHGAKSHPTLRLEDEPKSSSAVFLDWELRRARDKEEHERSQRKKFTKARRDFQKVRAQIATGEELGALSSLAMAYMGSNTDLPNELQPEERLCAWIGTELAQIARNGFIAVLYRQDLPTATDIAKVKASGMSHLAEDPIWCGLREMKGRGLTLTSLPYSTLRSILAIWWDRPGWGDEELGVDLRTELEHQVFRTKEDCQNFLTDVFEPYFRAGATRIPGLFLMTSSSESRDLAGLLAFKWIREFPNAPIEIQEQLLKIISEHSPGVDIRDLLDNRLAAFENLTEDEQKFWTTSGLVLGVNGWEKKARSFAQTDPSYIWYFRRLSWLNRSPQDGVAPLGLKLLEFAVLEFANQWPLVGSPSGWSGDPNPWAASRFICDCIQAIGSNLTAKASECLEQLANRLDQTSYRDQIKHARAKQLQARLDSEYMAPSFQDIKQMLAGGPPGNIDDLRALTLDQLATIQKYTRDGDTRPWEKYWSADDPLDEDKCRNRLLEELRQRMREMVLNPEILMPAKKRVDILVQHGDHGVPIEIKGQWHPDVWHAASTQLEHKYTRDWRVQGRGIYLVFWFGKVAKKDLPAHPKGRPAPATPGELQEMLVAGLTESERSRIDVVVFDVSKG